MKTLEELKQTANLLIIRTGHDGGVVEMLYGKLRASVIWSWGGGWEHVSISPYKHGYTPSWDEMCRLKDIFFRENEVVIQFHPAKSQYVNNMPNCLHLWRCTCEKQPIPPSIFVGIRDGQSIADARKEIAAVEAAELAKAKKMQLIDEYLMDEHINDDWRQMIREYRSMLEKGV